MTRDTAETRAVIWDMDGVIADTAPYHFRAWHKVFEDRGVSFTETDFKHNFGRRNDDIIKTTLSEQTPRHEIEAIAREKEETFRKLARQNLKPHAGVIELIQLLKEHGFKQAIASSAPIENINLVARSLGIDGSFHSIVTGQDVSKGKPSPQGFLLAAQKLGAAPGNCIVIEDAIAGVAAAKRAGMHCIAVTNTHPREKLKEADLIVDSLDGIKVKDLDRLLDR